ncbi:MULTISPECIES: DUF1128 domain-containing protein [Brevibacillus]|uniref:DUF1128 domain-containing protein n=1 Tax=Brevibacillus laterosporus TaxID=1465 RepID=A0AAP3DLZ2_BRELA|nr:MULTISPECIES: DUF1128 domain-containing protein [Brevibacillus]ATO48768.1 hypothetical protein BrL25_06385 [Brevibacillus laterosporus DSM 25]AYB41200.1 DUF1128 domain-containing protein [Brevibacillus laterosporus]MBG9772154.1 hypothetical protein [Brevibacillus laterosporus]MBG9787573.1 hypothetical protein [Brevibacillus laterosporus]MBG9796837.1 hypothetical protein [Brevibacillus laterosporus]
MSNLQEATLENLTVIIEGIKSKLNMANTQVMRPEDFKMDSYEDLLYLYNMVQKKTSFSVNEMTAIVEELGSMRKTD